MSSFKVRVKWGRELFPDVMVSSEASPLELKAQLFALTGVSPDRQKVVVKGQTLKDEEWGSIKLKDGLTLLLMGSKEEDIPAAIVEKPKFVEDMDEDEIGSALDMPAGLANLGNTCYMNATIQCLKTVPEFREALDKFAGGIRMGSEVANESLTSALRDLYRSMDAGRTVTPLVMLQVLHMALPRFAERGERGGYQQQDANECWVELVSAIRQQLKASEGNAQSVIDRFFGLTFDTVTKCAEAPEEPPVESKETFLQFNCYIDKDVKYLHSGLKNRLREVLSKNSPSLGREASYEKELHLSRLPAYLTVQMVRFQFKQREALNAKILKDIKFPLQLDVYDLCTEKLQQRLLPMRKRFKEYEDRIALSDASKAIGKEAALKERKRKEELENNAENYEQYDFDDDPGSNNSGYYELQAVLTHKGRSSDSGHYVAWVKHKGDVWIECNDDDTRPRHVEDILKLSGGGDWHTAYLLLYGPRRLLKATETDNEGKTEAKAEAEVMETSSK